MFIVIERADVELLSVRAFNSRADADQCFVYCVYENQATPFEWLKEEMANEVAGTLRVAGDDTYSVHLIEVTP